MESRYSEKKRKFIAIPIVIAILIIGIVGYIFFIKGSLRNRKILIENTRLSKQKVEPGENIELYVTIANSSEDNDATEVSVKIISPSPSITIKKAEYRIGIVGAGGSRSMSFSVSALDNILEGRYRIKIKTSANQPFEGDMADVYLKFKQTD